MTASARAAPLASRAEAEALLRDAEATMDALERVVAEETALVGAGRLLQAGVLQPEKARLAARHIGQLRALQQRAGELKRWAPERAGAVAARHDAFRVALQHNMRVLATARAVSEGLVGEIAEAVARQDRPVAYGAGGMVRPVSQAGARPVTLSRAV